MSTKVEYDPEFNDGIPKESPARRFTLFKFLLHAHGVSSPGGDHRRS
jgi:hypothetical protein